MPTNTDVSARERAQRNLVPHFTKGTVWQDPDLPVLVRGSGAYVWDADGHRFLDGLSGLFCVNLGYGRSDLASVAADQLSELAFATNWSFAHPAAADAAELIADRAPGDLDKVFFVNSGSEAVEAAVKLARCYHLARGSNRRHKIIARDWAYHGTTLGALSVTGVQPVRQPFEPYLWHGVRHVSNTSGWEGEGSDVVMSQLDCVKAVERAILEEGPESVSAVIAEPVQNAGGALVPPAGYWRELRNICDRHGVLLIADEVITGFGRLGHWFGAERFGVVPDLITFAKGATSGYAPLGGVIAQSDIINTIYESPLGSFVHGSTFGGHPVATALAAASIRATEDEGILNNVLSNEAWLQNELTGLWRAHRVVKEVRGAGYFYAIDLASDAPNNKPLTQPEADNLYAHVLPKLIREAGLVIRPDNRGGTMLIIAPPLICDRDLLTELIHGIDRVLTGVELILA